MHTLILPDTEFVPAGKIVIVHSLGSMSAWEAKHEKAFFGKEPMTPEETRSYIHSMIVNDDYPENYQGRLTSEHFEQVNEYINSKQTATWFREQTNPSRAPQEVVTAELIYYWMIGFQIPFTPCDS